MRMTAYGIALTLIVATSVTKAAPKKPELKKGEKIVFMGDSITAGGQRAKHGYVKRVMQTLNENGMEATYVGAGKSGHRSPDMLKRLEKDVIKHKPQWLVLSCGVNDVWHFKLKLGKRTFTGVPLEDYKKNITTIIDKAQAAGIKVMILESTMIGEDPKSELNTMLVPYNAFLKEIAKSKNCLFADLNTQMQDALKKIPDVKGKAKMFGDRNYKRDIKNKLTSDGCHPNAKGHAMMAKGVLKAFGLSDAKIKAAETSWGIK